MEAIIAREFHTTSKTVKRIAQEFKTTTYKVNKVAEQFPPRTFEFDKPMAVIKVEEKWVNHIIELLERRGIKVEAPEDYELVERFQSKINEI